MPGAALDVVTREITTTGDSAIVVSYNLHYRNSNLLGVCDVASTALLDGMPGRFSSTPVFAGTAATGGYTVAFDSAGPGTHTITVRAMTACANVRLDETPIGDGNTVGSAVTITVIHR